MKKFCFFLAVTLWFVSCNDDDNASRKTYSYFEKHLDSDMNFNTLRLVFGQPDDDTGSGIHIYVYHLDDGTRMVIGYTDHIMYARHVSEDNQLLHTLI